MSNDIRNDVSFIQQNYDFIITADRKQIVVSAKHIMEMLEYYIKGGVAL